MNKTEAITWSSTLRQNSWLSGGLTAVNKDNYELSTRLRWFWDQCGTAGFEQRAREIQILGRARNPLFEHRARERVTNWVERAPPSTIASRRADDEGAAALHEDDAVSRRDSNDVGFKRWREKAGSLTYSTVSQRQWYLRVARRRREEGLKRCGDKFPIEGEKE